MTKKVILKINWCWQCPNSQKHPGQIFEPDTWWCRKLQRTITNDSKGRPTIPEDCDLEEWDDEE